MGNAAKSKMLWDVRLQHAAWAQLALLVCSHRLRTPACSLRRPPQELADASSCARRCMLRRAKCMPCSAAAPPPAAAAAAAPAAAASADARLWPLPATAGCQRGPAACSSRRHRGACLPVCHAPADPLLAQLTPALAEWHGRLRQPTATQTPPAVARACAQTPCLAAAAALHLTHIQRQPGHIFKIFRNANCGTPVDHCAILRVRFSRASAAPARKRAQAQAGVQSGAPLLARPDRRHPALESSDRGPAGGGGWLSRRGTGEGGVLS
jgi:hypothetical protein